MSAREPRFVVVRRNSGWEAQLWAGSRLVWFTQKTYNRKRDALHAIDLLTTAAVGAAATPRNVRHVDARVAQS